MLAIVAAADAQAQTARIELRLVPQLGTPPATVTDLAVPPILSAVGQSVRLELQYRVVDLDFTNADVVAGLTSASIDITFTPTAGNSGAIDRALISNFEAQQAAASPPISPDNSGSPTGSLTGATGLHRPFRMGISNPMPNNSHVSNGTLSASGISGVTPLTLTQSDQGNVNAGQANRSWYGLYTFNWTWTAGTSGSVTIAADLRVNALTGFVGGYFSAGNPIPVNTTAGQGAAITISLNSAAAFGACCHTNTNACVLRLATVCAQNGNIFLGEGQACPPTAICATGACCCGSTCSLQAPNACLAPANQFVGMNTICNPIGSLSVPCCLADFDRSGTVSVQDIFSYLSAYFQGQACADINSSGANTVQDIFEFLRAYFVGCM